MIEVRAIEQEGNLDFLFIFPISCLQGHGKPLQIMQGMFRANGGCGYVKKPDFLLEVGANNEVFDPSAPFPVIKVLKVPKS